MKKELNMKDVLVTGFAMFAIFFGAGNLIFPPQIGLVSGSGFVPALIGLTLAGILFPMLAVAGVGNVGYSLEDVTKHVSKHWHVVFMVGGLLAGSLGTIPRAGAVAYEIGLLGLFPDLPGYSKWIFLILFFGISYYFASNETGVVDAIGQYLTPILLVSLLIIIVMGLVNPIGKIEGGVVENPFSNALLTAYNTGDVGTGIIVAGIFISSIRGKGYTEKEDYKKMMSATIVVGFILLFVIYGGLCYLGAQGTRLFPPDIDNTSLLIGLITELAGRTGIVFLSIAIIFACLTTAAGIINTMGGWVQGWTGKKVSFKLITLILTIIIFIVASTGTTSVIALSGPIFMFIFPMSVVMMVLGLFKNAVPSDGVWKGAVITASIMSLYDSLSLARINGLISASTPGLDNFMAKIPLASQGFAWLIPTIVMAIVGGIIFHFSGKESVKDPI